MSGNASGNLKRVIDQMVEQAIRRILPTVMNEVLIETIARGTSSIASEGRQVRPRKPIKKKRVVRERRQVRSPSPRKTRDDLREMLRVDQSAGAEFYGDVADEPTRDHEIESPVARRIDSLPPQLRSLAEGMQLDDDPGEMWGSDEFAPEPAAIPGEIRNIDAAARSVGIDFSQMKAVVEATKPKRRVDDEDLRAKAQFDQLRLQRMRDKLDGK